MYEDTIEVKIGRILFEKQSGEELYEVACGLKGLFEESEKKDQVAGTMAVEIAVASYFEGCPAGAVLASYCMLSGTGYQGLSDLRIPFEFFTEAGIEGSHDCAYNLGCEFDQGYPPYLPQNPVVAAYYFKLAADSGNSRAQLEMGNRYYDGKGVEIDFQQADAYWEAAAKQGVAAAQYNLGRLLDGSLSGGPSMTTYEPERAGYWLEQAARNGYQEAAEILNQNIVSIKEKTNGKRLHGKRVVGSLVMPRWKKEQYMDASGAWRMPGDDYIDYSGGWRSPDDPYVDASGAWRNPNDDYVDESGGWRKPGEQYMDHSGGWRF